MVTIWRHNTKNRSGSPQFVLRWSGYNLKQMVKWKWFFRYIAAKEQIKTPLNFIELEVIKYIDTDQKTFKANQLRNKIVAAKAKITKYRNRMNIIEKGWNELLPMEDHPHFILSVLKIEEAEQRLKDLMNQLKELEK